MTPCAECEALRELGAAIRTTMGDAIKRSGAKTRADVPVDVLVVSDVMRHAYHGGMGWLAWSNERPRSEGGMTPYGFADWLVNELRANGYEIVGGLRDGGAA